ncbi:hypothetical protein MUK42_33324, partial [Musa troglodytarum]
IDVYSTSQLVCETQATKKPRAVIINTPVPSHGGGRAIATHLLGKECFHIGSKVVKEGTWGGNAGNAFDTGRVDRFTKVKIYHGDVIYGLEITFVVGGKTQRPMVIGEKKRTSKEITLNEDEHFTSIKGYFKAIEGYDISITQLTLTTDKGRKVSAGIETGNSFSLALEKGGHIVSFFGLVGQPIVAVDAIGVHCSLADP